MRCAATWAMAPTDMLKVLAAPAVRRDQVRPDGPGRMGAGCQGDRVHVAHRLGWSWPRWPCKNGRASCLLSAVRPLSTPEACRFARGKMTRRELVVGVDGRGSGELIGLRVMLSGATVSRIEVASVSIGFWGDRRQRVRSQVIKDRAAAPRVLPWWRQGRLDKGGELSWQMCLRVATAERGQCRRGRMRSSNWLSAWGHGH